MITVNVHSTNEISAKSETMAETTWVDIKFVGRQGALTVTAFVPSSDIGNALADAINKAAEHLKPGTLKAA